MNASDKPSSRPDPAVEAAAAAWLVRHDRGLTPLQQDEFLQWLATNPAHRESLGRHRRMWSDLDRLAQWLPEHSAEPNPDLLGRSRTRHPLRWIVPVLAAAAAIIAAVLWTSPTGRSSSDTFAIETDRFRQETLPDGSRVNLNRGSHLVLQFSATERRVLLVQGEAQFEVTKNPARPFVVRAGGMDVRAVGTAFNVKLAGPKLEVLVTEGTVRVTENSGAAAAGAVTMAPRSPPVLAELTAGHRTVITVADKPSLPVVVSASPAEIEQILEWQPRLLDFESTPLAEVVEIFNRRNGARLVVADESLNSIPIVASIRSDNVSGFVRLLEATMGIKAEQRPGGEIALQRAR